MKRILAILAITTLSLGALVATGCVVDDGGDPAVATCNDFDSYLYDCYSSCSVTWDCETSYDMQDLDTQLDLDDCSICLADLADSGVCGDCSDSYGDSCQGLLTSALGVDCVW